MTSDPEFRQHSIQELIELLSAAIWARNRSDQSFGLFDHMLHPEKYRPCTKDELAVWEELTHPRRHEELQLFAKVRRNTFDNSYASGIDNLLLRDSLRKLETEDSN